MIHRIHVLRLLPKRATVRCCLTEPDPFQATAAGPGPIHYATPGVHLDDKVITLLEAHLGLGSATQATIDGARLLVALGAPIEEAVKALAAEFPERVQAEFNAF